MAAEIVCDAVACHAADPRADSLNDGHQRKAEQHGPSEAITELGADLTVGSDAARVVVGCTGYQPGSKGCQEPG